jgi:RNA polymerase sigma factor (sigma-70 family)
MFMPAFNEEIVLAGCRKNDRRSQELLYKHFSRKMYAICLSYAGERPLAQDILQEAFVKIFKSINFFNSDGSLGGWIRRIVTNTAIDHIRKKQRAGNFIDIEAMESNLHTQNPAPDIMGFNELITQVGRLPDGARLIFNLHALEGFTHKEISERLDITEGTSKSQFNRARKLLISFIGNINLL